MKDWELKYLRRMAREYGIFNKVTIPKTAQENPLDNSMWENTLNMALKGLETVAILSLDWKLTAIVKLLQSWLKDKREQRDQRKRETEYGVGLNTYEEITYGQPYDSNTYY